MAGVTGTPDNDEDEAEDEDITGDMGTVSNKKSKSTSSSSKSMAILSRSTSEYDTCAPDKSVEFDPVQGNPYISLVFCLTWLASSSIAFYRYALLLLRKSEGEQRMSNQSQSDNDDDVRIETTNLLQQKSHKRRR